VNARKDLVIEGEVFHWEQGQGNYTPPPKHLPYTGASAGADGPPRPLATPKPVVNTPRNRTKNVLLIVCDDLNTHVTPSGYANILTPAMDAFAAQAMTFERAFCQYPVCGPSRASMLSGLYPQSTGVLNNTDDIRNVRADTITMPKFFQDNGFWTGSVGKVFHSPRHEQGEGVWDEFYRFENDELAVVKAARVEFESLYGSVEDGTNRRKWKVIKKQVSAALDAQTPPGYGESGLKDEQHKDGKNARQVAKWLSEKQHGDKPFFIACGIQKPHVPFLAPRKYFDLYPLDSITYQPDRPRLWDTIPSSAQSRRYEAFGFELGVEDDRLRREYMQAYHACISFIDAQIQIVLDAVRESGHWEDTTIILTSDHGYHLGEHFLWGKVTLFDIGAKVPFMIRAPGLTSEGARSQAMVELIDIFPTVSHLTGLEAPGDLQGKSLRPLLGHPERLGKRKYAYSVVTRGEKMGFALRDQRWRYGKWPDGEELYNLSDDPQEKRNLAALPHVNDRLQEFRGILESVQERATSGRKPSKN
jgi:iduronate 2-sulfatase